MPSDESPEFTRVVRPTLARKSRKLLRSTQATLETLTTGDAVQFLTIDEARRTYSNVQSYLARHRDVKASVRISGTAVWLQSKGDPE